MIVTEASGHPGNDRGPTDVAGAPAPARAAPVTTLRGAGVSVDVRVVTRVATGCAFLVVAVVSAALLWAGVHKNAQITRLQQQGVPVEVTVTGCRGLMGGSGSNLVGYECRGTFMLAGHRHEAILPDGALRAAGSTFRAVSVPGDPGLLSTARVVASEHPSWSLFVAPAVLLLLLALSAVGLARGRRRARRRRPSAAPRV